MLPMVLLRFGFACFLALLGFALSPAAAPAHEPVAGPDQLLRHIEPATATRPKDASRFGSGRGITTTLHAFGRDFLLDLEPSRIVDDPAGLYEGIVQGEVDSRAAISIDGIRVDGLVRIGSEIYFFEPAQHFDPHATPNMNVAYRLSDISTAVPGADPLRRSLRRREQLQLGQVGPQLGANFPARMDIALVADDEYSTKHGTNTEPRMLTILNMVNAIYLDQLKIRFRVTHQQVFRGGDPFSEFNSGNLFSNFKNAATEFGSWRSRQSGAAKTAGVGHLFSDRTLGLTSGGAGFGFINTLCSASKGVAISTTPFFNSTGFHALIVEHELGHNFGAPHDGESGSCASAPPGHIMAPSATGTTFSDCSKTIMTNRAQVAGCVTDNVPMSTTTTSTTTTTTLPPAPCAQPLSSGPGPSATDCLFILKAAVGAVSCSPACVCAPKGNLPPTATDALICLKNAVGSPVPLNCPC